MRFPLFLEKHVVEGEHTNSLFKDTAALRRALYEYRFMNRERDGSRYWLTGTEVAH